MVVSHFLRWLDTARVSQRAAAAAALARAYIASQLDFEDRCAAEAALTFLLDDPSAKVRLAMAEVLSMSQNAPLQIVSALAGDQPEIASLVLTRSPVLTEHDLIDRVASGDDNVQRAIAERPLVSMQLAAAIAEVGCITACLALLRNEGAEIASLSFRRIAMRHGDSAWMRQAMLADRRLPADSRHYLLVRVGEVLSGAPLIKALMGQARAERIMRDACLRASLTLIDNTETDEFGALAEHMRLSGDLTPSFLVRMVAHGKIDFFGAVLQTLSGQEADRIRALLASGREGALAALFGKAGIVASVHSVIICALRIWRDVANGNRIAGTQEVSWLMLKEINATPGQSGPAARHADLAVLLRSIHLDVLRANARGHALAITAA
jgi:uncharacterized protein (DUF2336 family)